MQAEHIKYRNLVRAIIRKFTGGSNEDLEQEIYLKAWQNRDTYEAQGKESAWLGAVAANMCKDYLRSRFFREDKAKVGGDEMLEKMSVSSRAEEKIDAKKRQKIILNAIDNLPRDLRKVIVWYEFEEKSYAEIAKKLNIPEGTVKSRLSSARKILAQQLQFLKGENE